MRNLLLLLSKFGTLFLFILLELISLFLIINYNNKQKEIFIYSSNLFAGKILDRYNGAVDYLSLNTKNDSILQENAKLKSLFFNSVNQTRLNSIQSDSTTSPYRIIASNVSSKTIHMRNNRMTLDVGSEDGVRIDMGVISENGIVGIVKKVNKHFSSVIPIINTQLQVSAKIKNKNYFGDLNWQPYDERFIMMNNLPKHAPVAVGDTVITSGYSTVFPPDIEIGKIHSIQLPPGSNYFDIKVKLNNSLAKLEYVYLVDYILKEEKEEMYE